MIGVPQLDRLAFGRVGQKVVAHPARVCVASGCERTTRQGKPFCLRHVERNPHAAQVLRDLALAQREAKARRWSPDGPAAVTVLAALFESATSASRIMRRCDMGLDLERVEQLLAQLEELGLVRSHSMVRRSRVAKVWEAVL